MWHPSKRTSSTYNNIQPFDSHSLLNLLASKDVNSDDFKFISWKDFDIALESDQMLFEKLISLTEMENEIPEFDEFKHDHFVPLDNDLGVNDNFFYRVDRSANNAGKSALNEERISYQL